MENWFNMEPKVCPFCGAFGKGAFIELKEKGDKDCCVYCKFCGAEGPKAKTFEEAIIKWGRRECGRI